MSININRPCGTFDRNYYQAKELYRTPLQKTLLALLIVVMYLLPFTWAIMGCPFLSQFVPLR